MIPRPYQQRARADLYAAVRAGARRVVLCLPPGAGKTLVAFLMFADAASRGRDVWFLASRRALVTQPAAKFREYSDGSITPDVVMAGHTPDPSARLHVASVQTVEAREIQIPGDAVVFVDECHLAHADDLIAALPGATVIGLTATPQRENGVPLGDVWQSLVTGPTPTELVKAGVLHEPEVYSSEPPAGTTIREWTDDHAVGENAPQWWRRHADGLRTLACCATVGQARDLCAALAGAQIRACVLTAADEDEVRASCVAALERRDLDVVIVVGLFREGWDAPWLEAILDCAPTDSLTTYVQRSARLHRACAGTTVKRHLDLAKNVWRHGLPLADREWALATGGRLLVDAPSLRRCRACGNLAPPGPRCPRCGVAFVGDERVVETVASEIRRFTAVTEADRAQRLADEERDRKRRRVLHGIAYARWKSGVLRTRGESSTLAGSWWTVWRSRGNDDWRGFLRSIE